MRERIARLYALGLGIAVVALAALFAERQNAGTVAGRESATTEAGPEAPPARTGADAEVPAPAVPPDPAVVARGRTVLREQGCLRCHRVEGEGSPRSPLDGVGSRLTPQRIRAFVVADEAVRGALPASVVRAKTRYAALPEADLEALVTYLTTMR